MDPEIRKKIISSYSRNGLEWLQNEVKEKDSEFYQKGEMKNPQRLMRALVVKESTGNSILSYRKGESVKRDFNIVKIGLALPKDELHRNINSRVDTMMNNGLLDEVKSLIPFKNLNALHTVGYSELFEYLDHRISLDEAIERIKKNTRQYAKRQLTWFRKDKTIQWFSPKQKEMLESYAEKKCFLK